MGAIKATFEINNTKKIDMSMTIVMSGEDWAILHKELDHHRSAEEMEIEHWHPANVLKRAIIDLIDKANKEFHFYENKPKENSDGN